MIREWSCDAPRRGRARTARSRPPTSTDAPASRRSPRRGRRARRRAYLVLTASTAHRARSSDISRRYQRLMSADSSSIGANHPPCPAARRHPALDALADRPVLAVDEIPQVAGVGWIERRQRELVGVEQQIALDGRVAWHRGGRGGYAATCSAHEAEQQVGIDQLALVPRPLGFVEAGERPSTPTCPSIVNVHAPSRWGMPVGPVEPGAAAPERRDERRTARDAPARSGSTRCSSRRSPSSWPRRRSGTQSPPQLVERVPPHTLDDGAELPGSDSLAGCESRTNTKPPHSATASSRRRIGWPSTVSRRLEERRRPQPAVEPVGPPVVRAADHGPGRCRTPGRRDRPARRRGAGTRCRRHAARRSARTTITDSPARSTTIRSPTVATSSCEPTATHWRNQIRSRSSRPDVVVEVGRRQAASA